MEWADLLRCEYSPPKEGDHPLHRAVRIGDCDEIRRLIASGERIDMIFFTEVDPGPYIPEATPFMVAAGSSDGATVETLRVLLELGADPRVEIEGLSAAIFACQGLAPWHKRGGDAERLRFVLNAGSPLPADPEDANKLLCDTAATGDAERVRVLLEYGLNPSGHWDPVRERERRLALNEHMEQYKASHPETLVYMSEDERARIAQSRKESDEQTLSAPWSFEIPLFRAAESGNVECVRLLIDSGADPKARDNSKRTAMYYASSAAVAKALMDEGLSLEDVDDLGWSPLDDAVSDGDFALPRIRALIEAGARIDGSHGRESPIFCRALHAKKHSAVLRLLLASGANPLAATECGSNAFHFAINSESRSSGEESVRATLGYLKELGVSIEQRNSHNKTPLAKAIWEGSGVEVSLLCELGADPNAVCTRPQRNGDACVFFENPLLFHAAAGSIGDKGDKTEALIKAGADALATDADGWTPVAHAVASLCKDAADYPASFQAFFWGLGELPIHGKSMPTSRDEFLAAVTPTLSAYVERFASDIPLPDTSQFHSEWRRGKVACVVLLCAHESWARHEQDLRQAL